MKLKKWSFIILLIIIIIIILIFTILVILNHNRILENYENLNINNLPLPYDVIIVGCARNIESHLSNTKEKLEMIKSLFKSSKIIIYENDSTDKTLYILTQWNKDNFIQLITEKDVKGIRTERLAYARNLLYNEAVKHSF